MHWVKVQLPSLASLLTWKCGYEVAYSKYQMIITWMYMYIWVKELHPQNLQYSVSQCLLLFGNQRYYLVEYESHISVHQVLNGESGPLEMAWKEVVDNLICKHKNWLLYHLSQVKKCRIELKDENEGHRSEFSIDKFLTTWENIWFRDGIRTNFCSLNLIMIG